MKKLELIFDLIIIMIGISGIFCYVGDYFMIFLFLSMFIIGLILLVDLIKNWGKSDETNMQTATES